MKRLETGLTELLSVPEVARRTGLGLRQLRRGIKQGELRTFDFGWPRLKWCEVCAWIESREIAPDPDGTSKSSSGLGPMV